MSAPGQPVGPPIPSASGSYATPAKVEACLEALTARELRDLIRWGDYFAQMSRNKFGDGEDLLSTVLLRMVLDSPERNWCPEEIKFVPFLIGAMKSVAHSWYKTFKSQEVKEEELPLWVKGKKNPNNEQAVINEIRDYLATQVHKYPHAVAIFDRIGKCSATDIQQELKITRHEFEVTVEWMRKILEKKGYRR